tara:strand:- start:1289 stop:2896 length:1608 start_codon:yes stop_codon:yes gene_type:complete
MKIWEKVNNITGNDSKSRYLIPYINAGSKFLLSALPEKFLWTIATETEINGWDTNDTINEQSLGQGSAISYDKILAVYRYEDGDTHTEGSSPDDVDYYKGKKRIAVEAPDKNIHIFDEPSSLLKATKMFPKYYKLSGKIFIKPDPDYNATDSNKTYTELGASGVTTVTPKHGDKGVIVYSAPPIVDENSENWILTEYENIVLFYAASLDHFRLGSVYRDLCKAQIDEAASKVLTFNLVTALPTFSFNETLPSDIAITSKLPSNFSINTSLPTLEGITSSLPSDFSSPLDISEIALDIPLITDALTKAQSLVDNVSGGAYTTTAEGWLADEDAEMVASTIGVANLEINRAQASIAKVNQDISKYQNDVQNYASKVSAEATRMTSQLGKMQAEVDKKIKIFQSDLSKYQQEIAEKSASSNVDVSRYNSELTKEKSRIETKLASYQAALAKAVQSASTELQIYTAEIGKESKNLEKQIQQQNINMQSASAYTQKSQQSIQTSGMYYQRAVNELSAITGAITAPEQQQASQRKEQGATS